MRLFHATSAAAVLPSSLAQTDFIDTIHRYEATIHKADERIKQEPTVRNAGLVAGLLGGLTGAGAAMAVSAGILSAVVLPLALPLSATVGLASLGVVAVNKIASIKAWDERRKATWALHVTYQDMIQAGVQIPVQEVVATVTHDVDSLWAASEPRGSAKPRRTPSARR